MDTRRRRHHGVIDLPLVEDLYPSPQAATLSFVAVNLQTAWLSSPLALSAYLLKGMVPEWNPRNIYIGMRQLMVIQLISLILLLTFPQIALWLPKHIYGK